MKWCGKCKKMVETYAEIILRVEDSQLAHTYSWPRSRDSLGKSIAGSLCVRVSNMACVVEEILDFGQGYRYYVCLDWLSEGYGLSAYGNRCGYHQ